MYCCLSHPTTGLEILARGRDQHSPGSTKMSDLRGSDGVSGGVDDAADAVWLMADRTA
jgi:hypothetical protein